MLNYHYFKFHVGTTIVQEIDVPVESHDLKNSQLYNRFLCTAQSVFDSSIFHKLLVEVMRPQNILVLHMCTKESKCVVPGRYTFDLLSKNSCAPEHIIIITQGIIYFEASPGLEMIDFKDNDPNYHQSML
jgi:hypothetical protein